MTRSSSALKAQRALPTSLLSSSSCSARRVGLELFEHGAHSLDAAERSHQVVGVGRLGLDLALLGRRLDLDRGHSRGRCRGGRCYGRRFDLHRFLLVCRLGFFLLHGLCLLIALTLVSDRSRRSRFTHGRVYGLALQGEHGHIAAPGQGDGVDSQVRRGWGAQAHIGISVARSQA